MYPLSALVALLIAAAASAQTTTESYAWPLDLPRELTSSFGEYRPGRYHMGIDLRTGPIGKDVHAAADGYVSRIRCSPYGYGKAVYIQLADGNSAVYAHLSDFAPALRDYVRRAQHEREEYTVDLTPKPGEFPVKRGEVIAKSGQTGIGVPHLHYELRDKDGVAINSRLAGVTWPDNTVPEFRAVAVIPLSPDSRINGRFEPVILNAGRRSASDFYTPAITIDGRVAFAVDVFDPSAGSRLGVHRMSVVSGNDSIFDLVNDRISYDYAQDGAIAFAPFPGSGQFLSLWRRLGNDAESYTSSPGSGSFTMSPANTEVYLRAEDFDGNTATLTIPLRAPAPRAAVSAVDVYRGMGAITLRSSGQHLIATATFPQNEPDAPVLVFSGQPDRIPLDRIDARTFQLAFLPKSAFLDALINVEHEHLGQPGKRWVFVRRGENAHRISYLDLEIETQPDSPYGTLVLGLNIADAESDGELYSLGHTFNLYPNDVPLDAPITLSLPLPKSLEHPERALIYRRDLDKKKWVRQDSDGKAGRVSAVTRQLGVYALLEDARPPTLELLHLANGQTMNSLRPAIRAHAIDLGSGIDAFRATYNGKWLLVEYDPEQDLLNWERDEDLPAGAGTLAIEVRDHAGNVTRREVALTLGSPAP